MTPQPSSQLERLRREKEREAIALATQGRWREAVEVNRAILALFPQDVHALNRLGRALAELGRYSEARSAFQRALEVDPSNSIARKNLDRLRGLEDRPQETPTGDRVASVQVFIEERGKTCRTRLQAPAPPEERVDLNPGEEVELQVQGDQVAVYSTRRRYLGRLEPRLARRLIRLMQGGNRYTAAIAAADQKGVEVIIREVFQHPSLMGVVSFPSPVEEYAYLVGMENTEAEEPEEALGEEPALEEAPEEEEEEEDSFLEPEEPTPGEEAEEDSEEEY